MSCMVYAGGSNYIRINAFVYTFELKILDFSIPALKVS